MTSAERERVGLVLDHLGVGYAHLDADWVVTTVNAAAGAITRTPVEDLVGRDHWAAFPDMAGTVFDTEYRRARSSSAPVVFRAFYPAPLDVWVEVRAVPSGGGLDVYFTDVTDKVRATEHAQATADRLALLARVADALLDTSEVGQVLDALPRMLVPQVADACVVTVLGPDGRAGDVAAHHADPAQQIHLEGYAATRLVDLPADAPFAQVVRTGQAGHLTVDQIAAVAMDPAARAHLDALGPMRGMILPLRARGRAVGALTLLSTGDRPRDLDTEAIAADIADRLGTALEADRLATARGQLVEQLQRSLLTDPPEPDHAQIVVRYLPGATPPGRGGRGWYDAFVQPDGCTMLVIGDVAGHDTAAAATMGQLRGLLRGIATYSGACPADVLRGLDAAMQTLQVDTLATCAIARFEQTPDEVERGVTRMIWANAGHPPPVVIHTDGTLEVLDSVKGDLLLGVDPDATRTEHVTILDRDATVLLYTDGLIERRDTDLDTGVRRLTQTITDLAGTTLDHLCDGLLHRLVDGHPDDDIALVAIRLHRQDRPRPTEAGPRNIPPGVPEPAHPAQ